MRLRSIACVVTLVVGGCAAEGSESELAQEAPNTSPEEEIAEQTQELCNLSRPDVTREITVSSGFWGSWGCWDRCPEGSWAQQIQTQWDCAGGGADCSGVNVIELSCHNISGTWTGDIISSSRGWWGFWSGFRHAPDFRFARGMKTFTLPPQGTGDDQSMTRALLVDGSTQWGDPSGNFGGDFEDERSCEPGEAICGIKTRREAKQGTHADDTALNGVAIACCPVQ